MYVGSTLAPQKGKAYVLNINDQGLLLQNQILGYAGNP